MPRTAPAPNVPAIPGMNPGIIVAGGGGAGGGAGAGGGKGKGGKKGANGQDGEDNGADGKKGSGACGNGSNESCNNCNSSFSAGDPVDVCSGQVFTPPKTDLFLPGGFNLELLRSYNSANRNVNLGMGYGWSHSLAWKLVEGRRSMVLHAGDGTRVELPKLPLGAQARNGQWVVRRTKTSYQVRPGNEFVHHFVRLEGTKEWRLAHVVYRNRGYLTLDYERGQLTRVIDTVGREVCFSRDSSGRIISVSVPSPKGRSITFARYEYDSYDNLITAYDADGSPTQYHYDEDHRLTRLQYASGLVLTYVYDRKGRCVETWGEYPGQQDPALEQDLPTSLTDGTAAKGIFHCKLEFYDDGYVELFDSVRFRRFSASDSGVVAKLVDSAGAVTDREFDDSGRVVKVTDANGATWRTEYDDDGAVVLETDPVGHCVAYQRDSVGRLVGVIDQTGGRTQIWRDPFGETHGVELPNGTSQRYLLGQYARVVQRVDARGARHEYEFDAHANRTAYITPEGHRYEFSYDYWGRLVSERNPLGHVWAYEYTDSGNVARVTSPLGRVTQYRYDVMGNPAAVINSDGSTLSWRYGGLNWLIEEIYADGNSNKRYYNREGWLVRVENERGESYHFRHNNTGLVVGEVDFAGRVFTFEHDGNGSIVAITNALGKVELERDLLGRIIKQTAADGQSRDYVYNARGELIASKAAGVEFQWLRDEVGNIVEETFAIEGKSYSVKTQRDAAGARLVSQTSLGHELRTSRTIAGRVRDLSAPGGPVMTMHWDSAGRPVRRDLPGGAAIVDSLDAEFRIRERRLLVAGEARLNPDLQWMSRDGHGQMRVYDYTTAGELHTVVSSDGTTQTFEYDLRRHIKHKSRNGRLEEEYAIDATGNYCESGLSQIRRNYAAGDVLRSRGQDEYVHDEVGFLSEKRRRSVGGEIEQVTEYEWDGWGMLSAVVLPDTSRVEFLYDAFARRVAKRVVKDGATVERHHYVWDLVSMVHDATVDSQDAVVDLATYLYFDNWDDTPLGQRSGTSDRWQAWQYYFAEPNAAPESIVDGSGAELGRLSSSTFGHKQRVAGTADTPFRYPGQQADPETGLHYNRYRYYDPDLGRYISPDPTGLQGGLNFYAYGPNPNGWVDPMGWKHYCLVVGKDLQDAPFADSGSMPANFKKAGIDKMLISGSAAGYNCPPHLESQPRCHTEQKHMDYLLGKYGDGKGKGKKQTLLGEMPPCPRCHSAMMRTAENTGMELDYKWKDKDGNVQTLTYKGGTGEVAASGKANSDGVVGAQQMADAYKDHKLVKPWTYDKNEPDTQKMWGVEPTKHGDEKYNQISKDNVYQPREETGPDGKKQQRQDYWSQQDVKDAEAENQRYEDANKPKKPGPSKEK